MSACLSNSTISSTAQATESGISTPAISANNLRRNGLVLGRSKAAISRERLARRRMDPRGKQAVGQRLREHVGKLLLVQIGDECFTEGGKPVVQPAVFLLMLEGGGNQITDDACHAGHALGEFFGGADGEGGLLKESGEQLSKFLFPVGQRPDFALGVHVRDAHGEPLLPADEPAELQVVGEKPVGQAVAVTDELLATGAFPALHFVEIRSDVFGLDVPERNAFAGDLKIRAAARDALWLVRGRNPLARGFQKRFQGGSVGVLGRVTGSIFLLYGGKIISKGAMWQRLVSQKDFCKPPWLRSAESLALSFTGREAAALPLNRGQTKGPSIDRAEPVEQPERIAALRTLLAVLQQLAPTLLAIGNGGQQ